MLSKSDILFTAIFLILASVFGYLFHSELFRSIDETEGTPIGRVLEIKGITQRRPGRQTQWANLSEEEILYKADALQTGNDSELSIYLERSDDGDEIRLGPNSYVSLNLYSEEVDVFFSAGNLIATGSDGLSVSMEGTRIQLNEKSSVSLEKNAGMPTVISILEGSVTLDTGEGEQRFGMDSTLYLDEEDGSVSEEALSVVVNEPRDRSRLLSFEEYKTVDFDWTLKGDWTSPVLEISAEEDFSDSNFYSETKVPLGQGTWFWRVVDRGSDQKGEIRQFSVVQDLLPVIVSPSPGRIIEYHGMVPGISMQWKSSSYADSYLLELSKDPQFSSVEFSGEVRTNAIMLEDLDDGTWWWRVKPLYRNIESTETIPLLETASFTIEKLEDYKAAQLLSPPPESSFSILELGTGIPFRWMVQDGVRNYSLKIANDRDMTDLVDSWEGTGNWTARMSDAEPGTYFWQVEGKAADGSPVPLSDIRSFTIRSAGDALRLVMPGNGGVVEQPRYGMQTFLWESDLPGLSYITLSKLDEETSENRKIIQTLLKGDSFSAVLPGEGQYSWRIQIQDEAGEVLLQDVESRFALVNEYIHDPVAHQSPEENTAIPMLSSLREGVTLRWQTEEEGDFLYTVFLEKDDAATLYRTANSELTLRGLEPGTYSWSVLLKDQKDYESPESGQSSFTVNPLMPLKPLVPLRPLEDEVIDLTGKNSLGFSWQSSPGADYYTIDIRDKNSGEILYKNSRVDEPSLILEDLSILNEGQFFLEIQGFKDYPELNVQRSTELLTVPFSLNVNIPIKQLEILSDETQYTN